VREYVFIADYFLDDFRGGAEFVNDQLIDLLIEGGHQVDTIRCQDLTPEYVIKNRGKYFILSNFMRLNRRAKEELLKVNYVLYEHDHKYAINRNPADFPNLQVPTQQLVNQELYLNANVVYCQSEIHKKAIEVNIPNSNVVSLGSSLWSPEFLDNISEIPLEKTKKAAIIEDSNPIKQQGLAEKFCKEKNIDYDLVSAADPLSLAKELAQYEFLVFFPKVLETFSRVSVEAKMVGCKLYTNNLLGAASESWFSKDKNAVIQEMRLARNKTYKLFTDSFELSKEVPLYVGGITVILNAYRRPQNLKKQLEAIRKQSIVPDEVWLWINHHEDNDGYDFKSLGFDKIIHNDYNWKFYGRFAGALLSDTEYVAIFDDDTIPGHKWFENCLNSMDEQEGIMGSAGYIQTGVTALEYDPGRAGWPLQNEELMRVDYVGHAWFFKREWLSHLWREKPCTWDNGEDIHFSYTAQKYGNIQTYCPPHPSQDKSLHGSLYGYELGVDDKATSNNVAVSHKQFFSERNNCILTAIKGGWKTVYNIDAGVQK
jgi:hypothetical protein